MGKACAEGEDHHRSIRNAEELLEWIGFAGVEVELRVRRLRLLQKMCLLMLLISWIGTIDMHLAVSSAGDMFYSRAQRATL